MKPNTRLLIRFTLPNGDMKGWGYDEPYFKSMMKVQQAILVDFEEWPENIDVHAFYNGAEKTVAATNNFDLAAEVETWLRENGVTF